MNSIVNSMQSLLHGPGEMFRTSLGPVRPLESFGRELSVAFRGDLKKLGVDFEPGSRLQPPANPSRPISAGAPAPANNLTADHAVKAPLDSKLLTLPPNAADDAYWSRQPAAVQQLRYLAHENDREVLGRDLAAKGYAIDVPIMVWGWDAEQTMALRQSYGYTWVPSATSQGIQEAPGIHLPGLIAYDPHNPPPGSILVPSGAVAT